MFLMNQVQINQRMNQLQFMIKQLKLLYQTQLPNNLTNLIFDNIRSIYKREMDPQLNDIQQNSLSHNLNQHPIDEQLQEVDYSHKIDQIHHMISKLSQQEEILKQTLKYKQRQLLDTFKLLDQRKKIMRDLVINLVNSTQFDLDIGLSQEFQQLKALISSQKKEIQTLKDQIAKQDVGLSGKNNDQDFIRVYTKIPQIQKQIEIGRKFASTQYVRDYFDKPQVYKVAYQQVKYQYQIRTKIKESLEQQKQHYLLKKDQIIKAMSREKQIQQQLLKQKDTLLKELKLLS